MNRKDGGWHAREQLDRASILRRHPFFSGLDPAIVNELGPRAVTKTIRKGAVLFRKGDPGSSFCALLSGAMRVGTPFADGRGAVFNLILPGEIFGEIAALDGGSRSADVVAIERSEVIVIDRREIVSVLRKYPELALRFIEILCNRIRHTSEQVEDIVLLDLSGRLAKSLLFLHRKAGVETAQGKIHATQREISHMIGASRESTNKQLRQWERRRLLRIERGAIVLLDPDKLADEVVEE